MPARRQMPTAALLSAQTSREAENPRSWAMAVRPKPSAAPLKIPASSASLELKTMVSWVMDQCLMACSPRTRAPPLVERRVRRHAAKSVSTYARRVAPSSCHGKW
eukprot:13651190-Alexandrium_andersonii.AAC.1